MNLLTSFFGRPKQPSPDEFGQALFGVALDRTNTLNGELESMGVLARFPEVQQSKQYLMQLTIFAMAPLDQLLAETPSPALERTRDAMRLAFTQKFRIQTPSPGDLVLDALFRAYAQAALSEDVLRLGQLATEAVGLDDADAEVLLLNSYTAALDSYLPVISQFDLDSR